MISGEGARWRVVRTEAHDAYANMALDEAAENAIREGRSDPTIRLYTWKPSAVSIGCFQGIEEEVNLEECRRRGIDVVRRRTGGGAVYHDSEGEITYSIIAPEGLFPKGIRESYGVICGYVISGLGRIGIKAEFAPINDIVVEDKKISGSAQTRRKGMLLQHGTVLYGLDARAMFAVLRVSREKISDKMVKDAEERVTCVKRHSGASIGELAEALLYGFTEGKEYSYGAWSDGELADAGRLREMYMSKEWNFSR